MAIIETNWNVERKDLKLFGTIGAVLFGVIAACALLKLSFAGAYIGKLLSWQMMAIIAVLCLIGVSLKDVPAAVKKYGIAGAIVCAALAILFGMRLLVPGTWLLVAIAAFFTLGALVIPELLHPVYLTALVATFPLGKVMGPLIMGVIFYGVFTPVAFLFRLIGRDTMTRKFDAGAPTYWVEHNPAASAKRYFRQF